MLTALLADKDSRAAFDGILPKSGPYYDLLNDDIREALSYDDSHRPVSVDLTVATTSEINTPGMIIELKFREATETREGALAMAG
jgi:hypothetical protein